MAKETSGAIALVRGAAMAILVALPHTAHAEANAAADPAHYGQVDCSGRQPSQQALQAALDAKQLVKLRAGCTYRITEALTCPANGPDDSPIGIVGHAIILGRSADFSNSNLRHTDSSDPHAIMIDCHGSKSRPVYNVVFRGFSLVNQRAPDGRYVVGLAVRAASNVTVSGLHIHDFPAGRGISIQTVQHGRIVSNKIQDFYTDDTTWGTQPQSTAIDVDGERVGSASSDLTIADNVIVRIQFGPNAIAAYKYQTDGINVHFGTNVSALRNVIDTVGEGIDWQTSGGRIANNEISNANIFCLKFIYNASRNIGNIGRLRNCGIAGVMFSSSGVAEASDNRFGGGTISAIDPSSAWNGKTTTAGVRFDNAGRGTFYPHRNVITNVKIYPGPNGEYAVAETSSGGGNVVSCDCMRGRLGLFADRRGADHLQLSGSHTAK